MQILKKYAEVIRPKIKDILLRIGYCSRPLFLIIGGQKCGTNALSNYLVQHPQIFRSYEKEIYYFESMNYQKGNTWYHHHFPLPHHLKRNMIGFEATPEYLYYPAVAERICAYNPQMKFIVLLRDPVERAFSAWNMHCRTIINRPETRKFDHAVREEIEKMPNRDADLEPGYVRRGLYYEQLMRYFNYFPRDQILITDSRSLKDNSVAVMNEITRFLELQEYDWHGEDLAPHHVGQYKSQIPDETKAFLRDFYKPHNEKSYQLLAQDFHWQ